MENEKKQTLNDIIMEFVEIEQILIENGGELTNEVEDRLDQNAFDLDTKLDRYEGFIRYLKGQAEYLKKQEQYFNSKRKTAENTIIKMRERIMFAMIAVGKEKVKTMSHSFSTRETESWSINEVEFKPEDKLKLQELGFMSEPKPLISELKKHYKDNEVLPSYINVTKKKGLTVR